MLDTLLLQSGNDIPFMQAQVAIHQPILKQIGYIGQETFFTGCKFLNFSKEILGKNQNKSHLLDLTDFEVLMGIINDKENSLAVKTKLCVESVLLLMFPDFDINFLPISIMISKDNQRHLIDKDNFNAFKIIVKDMFCLDETLDKNTNKYNPGGPQAKALVQKFKQRQRKLMELKNKNETGSIDILSRYISILSVGLKKDKNELLRYTIPQLFDEFNRFKLHEDFEMYVKFKIAGAKDLQDVKNWMGDLREEN